MKLEPSREFFWRFSYIIGIFRVQFFHLQWLVPWKDVVGDRLLPVFAPIRQKLAKALKKWTSTDDRFAIVEEIDCFLYIEETRNVPWSSKDETEMCSDNCDIFSK